MIQKPAKRVSKIKQAEIEVLNEVNKILDETPKGIKKKKRKRKKGRWGKRKQCVIRGPRRGTS